MLREACATLGIASSTRCLPPVTVGAPTDSRRCPARRALDRLGRIMVLIAGADLTAQQRDLLWRRAQGTPFKQLEHETGVPDATLFDRHEEAIAKLLRHTIASRAA